MQKVLKLNNLLDNYDEFYLRVNINPIDNWIIKQLTKIKETRIITTLDISFILLHFDELHIAFDYSIIEKEKILEFLKSNNNRRLAISKIKKDWELSNKSNIIFNPQVSDQYLGKSPIAVAKAKKLYLSKLKEHILFHVTDVKSIPLIVKNGLINDINYFSAGNKFAYHSEKTYGLISIGASSVLDRIYPDPEYSELLYIEFENRTFSGWLPNWIDAGINLDVLFLLSYEIDCDCDVLGWHAIIGNIYPNMIKSTKIFEK